MTATTFDTFSAAQDLERAGIERKQAEAIAKAVHRGDEGGLRYALREMRAALATLETRLANRLSAVVLTAVSPAVVSRLR